MCVIKGQFGDVIELLTGALPQEEAAVLVAEVKVQEIIELLASPENEVGSQGTLQKVRSLLSELQKYGTKDRFAQVNKLLGLRSVKDHPQFKEWTKFKGRMDLFEKINQTLAQVGESL